MNLEDQVVNLELSKKLLTLGVKQNSYFQWYELLHEWKINHFDRHWQAHITAFTASELMELLPQRIILANDHPFNSFTLKVIKSVIVEGESEPIDINTVYIVNYECETCNVIGEDAFMRRSLFQHNIWDKNFSNALAKTLIHLYEMEYIKNEKT